MRSRYDLFRGNHASVRNSFIPFEFKHFRVLTDVQIPGNGIQKLQGIKLCLIPEFHRSCGRQRQRQSAGVFSLEPDSFQCLQLVFDLSQCIRRIHKRICGIKIAVCSAAQLTVFVHCLKVCFKIHFRGFGPEFPNQLLIYQAVLCRNLGGGVACNTVAYPVRLDQHISDARLLKHISA